MLLGMAQGQVEAVAREVGHVLLYVPVVRPDEFDVAISYLVRRLEENASSDNFLSAAFDIAEDASMFARERDRFAASLPYAGVPTQGLWAGCEFNDQCWQGTNGGNAKDQWTTPLLENLRNVPIAISHGVLDELVPVPGAGDVAVTELPVPGASIIAAFWTGPAASEVLRAAAEAGLARYKQPREFIHVEALPRTPTGKINRRALREAHRKDA